MTDVNLDQMCRLCLSTPEMLVNIFEDEANLPVRIMACCSLEVNSNDSLPKQICSECRYQLDKTYIFRMKSKNAESKLRRHIRQIAVGKLSHVFEEEDDVDDYADALAYVEKYEADQTTDKTRELEQRLLNFQNQLTKIRTNESKLRSEIKMLNMKLNDKSKELDELQLQLERQDIVDESGQYVVEMLDDAMEHVQEKGMGKIVKQEHMDTIDDHLSAGPSTSTKQFTPDIDDDTDFDEEEEDVIGARYECDPEEYAAIEKAVRATLGNQPNFSVKTNFQLKLEKLDPTLTKAEVVTDDGSVLFMEFNTESVVDNPGGNMYYECNQCHKEFSKYSQLKRHISCHKVDPHNRGLQCSYCERWCPTKSSLVRHERIHTGEKPFKCEFCNRSFVQKEILKRHYLVHTGEKPFECSIAECGEKFRQREQLKQHINKFHVENPVIELHKCPLCPKSFCHASGLSRHLLIHSGKTFDCEICLKSYSDRSALRRHQIAIHGEGSVKKQESDYEAAVDSITSDKDGAMDTIEPVTYSFEPKSSDTNVQHYVSSE